MEKLKPAALEEMPVVQEIEYCNKMLEHFNQRLTMLERKASALSDEEKMIVEANLIEFRPNFKEFKEFVADLPDLEAEVLEPEVLHASFDRVIQTEPTVSVPVDKPKPKPQSQPQGGRP